MMLENAGFQVFDLGVDVEVVSFVAEVQARDAQVIVGGVPVTRDFATRIGADGYGDDAPVAVKLVKELLA